MTDSYRHNTDSDNLFDLRSLLGHVKNSDVLVLFQSKEVLQRPWCLLELYTAITEGVPIVALNCIGKGYDFAEAAELLMHLETSGVRPRSTGAGVVVVVVVVINESSRSHRWN